jgi:hypothetical protein
MVCVILISSFICMCGCDRPLLQAKLGSSDLAELKGLKTKLDHVYKIVSTPTAHPDKCTEQPSWSVFKAVTFLTVNNMFWGLCGWPLCDKLRGKIVGLVGYVKDKVTKK